MKRLTKKCKDENGRFYAPNTDDVGETIENEIFQKLGKLEDLEEQIGMPLDALISVLLKKSVYRITSNGLAIEFTCDGIQDDSFYEEDWCMGCHMGNIYIEFNEYNKSWFLTREEAEKKLEEMKNESIPM